MRPVPSMLLVGTTMECHVLRLAIIIISTESYGTERGSCDKVIKSESHKVIIIIIIVIVIIIIIIISSKRFLGVKHVGLRLAATDPSITSPIGFAQHLIKSMMIISQVPRPTWEFMSVGEPD